MKKNSSSRPAKKAKQIRFGRMFVSAGTMIAIVAIIECILLLSFTTFSWIESSSSLIIASGTKSDLESMDVAKNTNYQVLISPDAAGNADILDQNSKSFYRTVDQFRFAKASSADGVNFFLPKTTKTAVLDSNDNPTGSFSFVTDGINAFYREGDTDDYNISYIYFDFKIRNTTQANKEFFFAEDTVDRLFVATCKDDTKTSEEKAAIETAVENAMRISFTHKTVSTTDTRIYSLTGAATNAVNDKSGTTSTQVVLNAHNAEFEDDGSRTPNSIFTSLGDNISSTMSVRIWLEDKALSGVSNDELASVSVTIKLSLVSDNIVYDQIYFNDYSYSLQSGEEGIHTTDTGEAFYFWAYNPERQVYMAFPMSRADSTVEGVPRWVTSCPISTFENLINNVNDYTFKSAFFGYGSALPLEESVTSVQVSGEIVAPDVEPYLKWKLPGLLQVSGSGDSAQIVNGYDEFTCFGATKSEETYEENEPVIGYLEFSNAVTPQFVSFKDNATAITGEAYNNDGATAKNYQFMSGSGFTLSSLNSNVSRSSRKYTGSVTADDNLYMFELSASTKSFEIYDGTNSTTQTQTQGAKVVFDHDTDAGKIYYYNPVPGTSTKIQEYEGFRIKLPDQGTDENNPYRIYFKKTTSWSNITIHAYSDTAGTTSLSGTSHYIGPTNNNTLYIVSDQDESTDAAFHVVDSEEIQRSITLNNYNVFAEGSTKSADKVVSMYYNSMSGVFSGYVPQTWLTGGTLCFRYDSANYYRAPSSGNTGQIAWQPAAVNNPDSSPIYTALGYTGSLPVASCPNNSYLGVGTWNGVRAISFSTELIDSTISSTNLYRISIPKGDNETYDYVMSPDAADLVFSAYVPSGAAISFKREVGETITTWSGGTPGAADRIYYPVSDSAGYYHLSVFVDATYDGIGYGLVSAINGGAGDNYTSSFKYKINGQGEAANPTQLGSGTGRWYVAYNPATTDYIQYVWTPYDYEDDTLDTVFTYRHNVTDGLYFVITEGYDIE